MLKIKCLLSPCFTHLCKGGVIKKFVHQEICSSLLIKLSIIFAGINYRSYAVSSHFSALIFTATVFKDLQAWLAVVNSFALPLQVVFSYHTSKFGLRSKSPWITCPSMWHDLSTPTELMKPNKCQLHALCVLLRHAWSTDSWVQWRDLLRLCVLMRSGTIHNE